MMLSRDEILAVDDRKTKTVEVPEWGGSVLVRSLSGEDRDAFEASLTTRRPALMGPNKGQLETVQDFSNMHAKLVSRSIVDESGARMFSDSDVVALGQKSAAALKRVFDTAAELSGIGDDALADAEGNSEPDPTDGSTSDSPATSG